MFPKLPQLPGTAGKIGRTNRSRCQACGKRRKFSSKEVAERLRKKRAITRNEAIEMQRVLEKIIRHIPKSSSMQHWSLLRVYSTHLLNIMKEVR